MTPYERIKSLCSQQGLTYKDLETRAGIATGSISRMRDGNPTVSTLCKAASVLGVPPGDLLRQDDGPLTRSFQVPVYASLPEALGLEPGTSCDTLMLDVPIETPDRYAAVLMLDPQMSPTIVPGDILIIDRLAPLKESQTAVFMDPQGQILLGQVVKMDNGFLIKRPAPEQCAVILPQQIDSGSFRYAGRLIEARRRF